MRPERKKKADKTSVAISVAVHTVLIGGVAYWAAKSGTLDPVLKWMDLVAAKKEEKQKEEPKPPEPTQQTQPQPNLPPPPGGAARSATVSAAPPGAPAAMGGTFFTAPKRPPGQGITGGGVFGGTGTNTAATAPTVMTGPKLAPVVAPVTSVVAAPVPKKLPPPPPLASVAKPTTIAAVFEQRAKATAVTDAIGSEQISKSVTSDAGDVVAKVTGTTIVEGKFVVVRGLSDRYTSTTLNGADVPTADPYRKSVQLDLFPTAMIDSIVVSKTFTPEQPGGFTGGAIDIVTKSFPARGFTSLNFGVAYNTQASLNSKFLAYGGGSRDWLGMDDGTRALPEAVRAALNTKTIPGINNPANAARLSSLTSQFSSTQLAPGSSGAPLNSSFGVSLGDTLNFLGQPFGLFTSLNYSRSFSFYENGINNRYVSGGAPLTTDFKAQLSDTKATEEASWSTAVNLAWRPLPEHEFSFNFIYNQTAEDVSRVLTGFHNNQPGTVFTTTALHFTERHLQNFQLKGKHHVPDTNIRFDWLASNATTSQEEPDLRYFSYFRESSGNYFIDTSLDPKYPARFFRLLEEENRNLKADLVVPWLLPSGRELELKFGAFLSLSERNYNEVRFDLRTDNTGSVPTDPNGYIRLTVPPGGTAPVYLQPVDGYTKYKGEQTIQAKYAMATLPVSDDVTLLGGARYETTQLDLTTMYQTYTPGAPTLAPVKSAIQANDLLPAAGFIWRLGKEMNLRFNFGQTIARPTYREIASVAAYDFVGGELLRGNPSLKRTTIDNLDLRWEWFPRPGEVLSASVFHKQLTNPIERFSPDADSLTYINTPEATLYGVELELRKKLDFVDPLLADFSLGANYTWIQSEVEVRPDVLFSKRQFDPNTPITRPLYDQSPYIFNADLSYDNARTGTSLSLVYNIAGERLYAVHNTLPDIYEQPVHSMDFVWSQRLRPGMKLKLSVRNLFDPLHTRTQTVNEQPLIYSANRKGRTVGLSLAYDF